MTVTATYNLRHKLEEMNIYLQLNTVPVKTKSKKDTFPVISLEYVTEIHKPLNFEFRIGRFFPHDFLCDDPSPLANNKKTGT